MKKLVLLAIVAVVLGYTAKAQDAEEFRENWQKTITVSASQTTTIEKLFTAWGKQFPGQYVDAFNKFKKTGKANKIEVYENFFRDFKVDLAPRNGYIEISTASLDTPQLLKDMLSSSKNMNQSIRTVTLKCSLSFRKARKKAKLWLTMSCQRVTPKKKGLPNNIRENVNRWKSLTRLWSRHVYMGNSPHSSILTK